MKLWDCLLKRLGLKQEPDVLLIGGNGNLMLASSEYIKGHRVIHHSGGIIALHDDGVVRGSYYWNKWEPL